MQNNAFFLDLSRGAQAEMLVSNYFRGNGYDVMDVTKNPIFWKKDIDLFIYDRDGTKYEFEVKADWTIHRTGNVVLELTNKLGEKSGWFNKTEASHIVFTDMENRIGYVARTNELRKYVCLHPDLPKVVLNSCDCVLVNINDYGLFQVIKL